MTSFLIEGGYPLSGDVTPSGNKNAALPLLAATILTDQPVILRNIPNIGDVQAMRRLLESLGATVELLDENSWRIQAKHVRRANLDPELCRRIRASILLAGPMLGREGGIDIPPPGGDVIGRRRVDTHLLTFRSLGATTEFADREYHITAPKGLQGANL